jgi:hypothetical protein
MGTLVPFVTSSRPLWNSCTVPHSTCWSRTVVQGILQVQAAPVLRIWDPDPIADPRTWIPDSTRSVAIWILLDRHHFGKLDPDPDPHQTEKVEALGGHFGALKGPNLEKVSVKVRIPLN